MPITIGEKATSRGQVASFTEPSAILEYWLDGTEDEDSVHLTVQATIPAFHRNMPFQNYRLDPKGAGFWDVTANYGRKDPGALTIDFDTQGATQKITQSLASYYYPVPGRSQVDFKQAINVQRSGGVLKVEGTEVEIAGFKFTLSRNFGPPDLELDGTAVNMILSATKKLNDAVIDIVLGGIPFHFEIGELFFYGCQGKQKGGAAPSLLNWEGELRFVFGYNMNINPATIAGVTGINLHGWDYVWVSYEDEVETTMNTLIPKPVQVNLEVLYYDWDMLPLLTYLAGADAIIPPDPGS